MDATQSTGDAGTKQGPNTPPGVFSLECSERGEAPRVFEIWHSLGGNSRFRCGGRCVTGPRHIDLKFNICAWCSLNIPIAIYFVVCGRVLWSISPLLPAGTFVLWIVSVVLMLATSCSDPGIIPRHNVRRVLPGLQEEVARVIGDSTLPIDVAALTTEPEPRIMDQLERHGYGWCRYCNMVQPPRAKHCRDCNSCVLRNDHHCPFVNNCIGQRNYAVFCGFLLSVSGLAISEASGFFLCWLASSGTGPIFSEPVRILITALLGVPVIVLVVCVVGLCLFHSTLVVRGRTTREVLTGRITGDGATLLAPRGPSMIHARERIWIPTEAA